MKTNSSFRSGSLLQRDLDHFLSVAITRHLPLNSLSSAPASLRPAILRLSMSQLYVSLSRERKLYQSPSFVRPLKKTALMKSAPDPRKVARTVKNRQSCDGE